MRSLDGKHGFAPVIERDEGREIYLVARVIYGVRGYLTTLKHRYKTFDGAERAAERLNRRKGLSDEEAWQLVENTVMCER